MLSSCPNLFRRTTLAVALSLVGCTPEHPGQLAPAGANSEEPPANASDNELITQRGDDKDRWWSELPRAAWDAFESISQSQAWFEVRRVQDHVLAIYEPGQFEEVISYLIVGSERALLFDTGLGIGDIRQVVRELTDLPVVVVNSHSHYDHIGGNHAFEEIWSPDTEYTRARAAGLPHEQVAEFVGPGWIWKKTPPDFSPQTYYSRAFAITRFLQDGEHIDLGGRKLEVILTPGHAPDALCLLDRDAGLLFTGDTFYLAPLYTHLEGSDFEQYRASAHLLAELAPNVARLMPGHNETSVDSGYLIRLREAFDQIAAGMEPSVIADGHRQYSFDGFSIVTQ